MKINKSKIIDIITLESEYLYSTDYAVLMAGSVILNIAFYLLTFLLKDYGILIIPLFGIIVIIYFLFVLASALFLIVRAKKYGLLISAMPIVINLVFLAIYYFVGWISLAA